MRTPFSPPQLARARRRVVERPRVRSRDVVVVRGAYAVGRALIAPSTRDRHSVGRPLSSPRARVNQVYATSRDLSRRDKDLRSRARRSSEALARGCVRDEGERRLTSRVASDVASSSSSRERERARERVLSVTLESRIATTVDANPRSRARGDFGRGGRARRATVERARSRCRNNRSR